MMPLRQIKVLSIFLFCFFCVVSDLHAGDSDNSSFEQKYEMAKRAYYEKNFPVAEKTLLELLRETGDNGYLNYNLGNVYFKKNEIGQAIRYYERARRSIPRFADLKNNLKQTEARRDEQLEESFLDYLLKTFYFWNGALSLNEFRIFFMTGSILYWGWLSFRVIKRRPVFKTMTAVATLFYVYFACGIYLKRDAEFPGSYGIILESKVEARASYLEKEQPLFILSEGTKVRIIDRQDFGAEQSWVRVALPQGQKGWISANQLGVI